MSDDLTLADPVQPGARTTVLVVDDNPVVRRGLRGFLETSERIEVVGEAADGMMAETMVDRLRPDVVLLDVRMPRRDGIETARLIADLTTVIMMTFTDEPSHIRSALAAGVSGYLIHGAFDADTLVQTVVGATQGTGAFSAQAMAAIREGGAAGASPSRRDGLGLSGRQVELMELIARGRSNSDIASELYLAEKTVKNHVNAIFAKLGVQRRGEAIAIWLGNDG